MCQGFRIPVGFPFLYARGFKIYFKYNISPSLIFPATKSYTKLENLQSAYKVMVHAALLLSGCVDRRTESTPSNKLKVTHILFWDFLSMP